MIKFNYTIRLEPSQYTLSVAQGDTILETALKAGYTVPHGCKQGICGACKAQKVSGKIRYHQEPKALTSQQQADDYILCCLARPISHCTLRWEPILAPGEFRLKTMNCEINAVNLLPDQVYQISLTAPSYEQVEFHPGQYLNIILPDGSERPFSIASSPLQCPTIELHIRHMAGNSWTEQVISALQNAKRIKVALPLGKAYLPTKGERPLLCIAGGTGFAPINAILDTLQRTNDSRELVLIWGGSQLSHLYLHESLLARSAQMPKLRYVPTLENADNAWSGLTGNVITALQSLHFSQAQLQAMDIFIAGSENMVKAVYSYLQTQGVQRSNVYADMLDILGL